MSVVNDGVLDTLLQSDLGKRFHDFYLWVGIGVAIELGEQLSDADEKATIKARTRLSKVE